ncbi:diguanylate cyclase [Simiduia agarivorans SA1 = DSM 21679]|uniref:diguanylate cyclase n=1 Tax=Simiduia agarivorans (strain DSM 21679 / JCM 13881 / BCRC 17597 / SA1) TaxID=1117647 RepID=K4KHF7_SIMAS|nr:diguanylate cyclase [Simiduia agarivorans SA1 = DSM 21679]
MRGTDLQALEDGRRVLLVVLLTTLGVATLLIFGVLSYAYDRYLLAVFLLTAGGIGILNLLVLFYSHNYSRAAVVMAFVTAAVSGLLVSTGGVDGTGILWVYPMMTVAIFTAGFRPASYILALFSCAILYILYWPENPLLQYEYSASVRTRFVVSFFCLGIITLAVEFVHSHSQSKVAELHSEVQHTAQTDALTQLPNRRYVSERVILGGAFAPVYQGGCVVLADVDHFKSINDRYGHDVGDVVLKSVAQFLASETRCEDLVVRWGGEEFLLVLPKINLAMAERRMDHVRRYLADMDVICHGARIRVTLSFGVTEISGSAPANGVLKRADQNLYLAKAAGRNRIVAS